MHLSKVLRARSAADRIREHYRNTNSPTIRRPTSLGEKDLDYHERLFRYFDSNRNRYLDKKELANLVKFQSKNVMFNPDVTKPFKRMDVNSDNRVSIQEYLEHVARRHRKLPLNRDLEEIFNMYDTNADAHINLDEMRQVLLYMGEDYAREDLRLLFVSVDKDNDGLIDLYQFLDLINTILRAKSS